LAIQQLMLSSRPVAGGEPFAMSRISERYAWLAGFVSASRLF
jgi:hypothetical protein